VLLDLEPEAGLTRFAERDRIEAESLDFHRRVRDGFLRLAQDRPQDYLVLDARAPAEEVERRVRERVEQLLGAPTTGGRTGRSPADVPADSSTGPAGR
jgi:dTMP kinase